MNPDAGGMAEASHVLAMWPLVVVGEGVDPRIVVVAGAGAMPYWEIAVINPRDATILRLEFDLASQQLTFLGVMIVSVG